MSPSSEAQDEGKNLALRLRSPFVSAQGEEERNWKVKGGRIFKVNIESFGHAPWARVQDRLRIVDS